MLLITQQIELDIKYIFENRIYSKQRFLLQFYLSSTQSLMLLEIFRKVLSEKEISLIKRMKKNKHDSILVTRLCYKKIGSIV